MLHVQNYLREKGLDALTAELGIVAKHHDELPLVILNYDQIESKPKHHPIVRECRGLVLQKAAGWPVVAKSMDRFFNWGEMADEMGSFDFANCVVDEKVDGSLVVLYYFDGRWHANTRGSFATDTMQGVDITWRQGFCKALGVSDLQDLDDAVQGDGNGLDRGLTYVCEFCSPWNKVVRRYEKPVMYLLTAFRHLNELTPDHVDTIAKTWGAFFKRPVRYAFKGIEEVQAFLQEQAEKDPTFEGVVLRDPNARWKVKSATYLGLHKMRGEGDNLFHPKHLIPFILAGEDSELLTYFNEVSEQYFKLKAEVLGDYARLVETWADAKDIDSQKDFALEIQGKTPYTALLFNVRKKYGKAQKAADLRAEWKAADQLILKRYKP